MSSGIPETGTIQFRLFCGNASEKSGQSVKRLNGQGLVFYAAFGSMDVELTFTPTNE